MAKTSSNTNAYWRANLKLVGALLVVWAAASYGLAIWLRPYLMQFKVGGADLGFWFAQQGAIYIFVALIFIYAAMMNRIDSQYAVDEHDDT